MKNKPEFLIDSVVPKPEKEDIQAVIDLGQKYISRHTPRHTPFIYLFFEQVKYLSPALWLTQILSIIVVFFWAFSNLGNTESVRYILCETAPLLSVIAVPEFIKDLTYNMSELESSCKNSGSTVLTMRLIAVGMINLIVISVLAGILTVNFEQNYFSLLLYALLPYNCANILSLFLLNVFKIRSRSSALVMSVISFSVMLAIPMQTSLISTLSSTIMLSGFIISLIILTVQIFYMFKNVLKGNFNYGTEN